MSYMVTSNLGLEKNIIPFLTSLLFENGKVLKLLFYLQSLFKNHPSTDTGFGIHYTLIEDLSSQLNADEIETRNKHY